jgi:hypothetical protein
MHSLWANSAFPELRPHVVLRLRLRPLSAGHELLLTLAQSPFTLGGQVEQKDLLLAALLCAGTFRDGLRLLKNPRRLRFFAALWRLVNWGQINWQAQLAALNDYLEAGRWSPPVCEVHDPRYETRELKAPRAWRTLHFLTSEMRLTEAQALDFPLARAAAYLAAKQDAEGTIDLEGGSRDQTLLAHLDDLERRAAAGEDVWN